MKVYLVDSKRTAVGSYLQSLKDVTPVEMGVQVVKNLMENNKINSNMVDELICGNVLSAGHGQNIARQILLKAKIDESKCAYTLNMVCGSALKSVIQAYSQIKSGCANLIIAGGSESMSMSAYLDLKSRNGSKMGNYQVVDSMINDALMDVMYNIHMGITAENIANKYNITRIEQDLFSYESQIKATNSKVKFSEEIVPLVINTKKGEMVFDNDEYIRENTSLEALARLKPAFDKEGSITAGNSSGINDGAAFCIVASEEMVNKHKLNAEFEIVGVGQGGVSPELMGMGPVVAIHNLLENTVVKFNEINLFELNEAFAAQSLGVIKQLSLDFNISEDELKSKINVNGGAIAIGHPVGASGARVLTTLVHEMRRSNYEYGVAALCIGGGMGVAILIRKVK